MSNSNLIVTTPIQTENLHVLEDLSFKHGESHLKLTVNSLLKINSSGTLIVDGTASFPAGINTNLLVSPSGTIELNGDMCTTATEIIKADFINGNVCFPNPIVTDIINERTISHGVVVNGALLKDGQFYANETDQIEIKGNRNVPNGYIGLDGSAKIPAGLLPGGTIVELQGMWNATTNMPHLASGVGSAGHMYIVSVAGNTTLDGISNWGLKDAALFDGVAWLKIGNSQLVTSVNSLFDVVVLNTDNINEGITNLYYTESRVSNNSSVSANTAHTNNTSNPHNVTASNLGNTTAQWNANKLQDTNITNIIPSDTQLLGYNGSSWIPVNPPSGIVYPQLMLVAHNSLTLPKPVAGPGPGSFALSYNVYDVISPNLVSFSGGSWTYPTTGTYRVSWGATVRYSGGGFQNADVRINFGPTPVQTFVQQTNSDVRCTHTVNSVWSGTVTAGTVGFFSSYVFSLSAGVTITGENYYITIEKWN